MLELTVKYTSDNGRVRSWKLPVKHFKPDYVFARLQVGRQDDEIITITSNLKELLDELPALESEALQYLLERNLIANGLCFNKDGEQMFNSENPVHIQFANMVKIAQMANPADSADMFYVSAYYGMHFECIKPYKLVSHIDCMMDELYIAGDWSWRKNPLEALAENFKDDDCDGEFANLSVKELAKELKSDYDLYLDEFIFEKPKKGCNYIPDYMEI